MRAVINQPHLSLNKSCMSSFRPQKRAEQADRPEEPQ